jgi:hypothetical protein
VTYGRLIAEAKGHLNRSLTAPVILPTPADALAVCQSRTRLYRVLAGGISLHLDLPRTAGLHRHLGYRGDGIKHREATLLETLRADLLQATHTTSDPTGPAPTGLTSGTATRLARAADAAGAAFDLLAGHLTTPAGLAPADSSPLRRGGTRITAHDAVQLTRALAHLDRRLELPIRAHAHPGLDQDLRRRLLATAEDCNRVTQHGIHQFATAIQQLLRTPTRQQVDNLDLATTAGTAGRPTPADPATAADLIAELRQAAHRRPERLSIPDLTAIASTAARLAAITAYASAPMGGPVGPALATARAWRALYQHLGPFATPARGRNLTTHAHRFRAWADPLIHHGHRIYFPTATWLPAIHTMTTDLTDLAHTITRAVTNKLNTGDLLLPFDRHTRSRQHLYTAAKPTDPRVTRLRQAATDTHHTTRNLTHAIHDLNPPPPSRPAARAPKTARPPTPAPGRAAGRTPPPPPQQAPQPTHRHIPR